MYENYNLDSGKIACMYKFYVIIYLKISCHCGLASCLKDEYDYDFDGGIENCKHGTQPYKLYFIVANIKYSSGCVFV